jgi:carboxyl-terminal processing protease
MSCVPNRSAAAPFLRAARRTFVFPLLAASAAACSHRTTAATAMAEASRGTSIGSGAASATCNVPAPAAPSASLAGTPVENPGVVFDSAWAIVARTHWDSTYNGVNWRGVRDELRPRAAAAKTTGELRTVLSEMVGRLKQSHFSIIPREVSDVAGASTSASSANGTRERSGEAGTVGVTLRFIDHALMVTEVDAGGSAARAGVRPGWILEGAEGCPVAPKLARIPTTVDSRRAALLAYGIGVGALSGAQGDTAKLTFRDGSDRLRALPLVRTPERGTIAKFGNLPPLPAHLDFERVKSGARTVGVIHFNIWMPVLARQFDAAIDSLRDTDAIVLDIRGNFGGVGGMAMGFAGHFLDSARTIGTMHQRSGPMKFVGNPRRVDTRARPVTPFAGPMAIVVDELSISTSEIFAAGMQALGRARIFGSQTAGQALPSIPERLPNGDILYHAIADFTSPMGKPIEGDGVRPDVVTPITRKALLAGRDPALDAAIAWGASAARDTKGRITP